MSSSSSSSSSSSRSRFRAPGALYALVIAALIVSSLLSGVFSPCLAQRSLARSLFISGNKEYEAGNYREALRLMREAAAIVEKGNYSVAERATLYLGLGETLRTSGNYAEAEKTFKKAMSLSETVPHWKNFSLCMIFNDMGILYQDMGRFPEAESLWQQSEKISGRLDYYPVNNLTRLYSLWGRFDDAGTYLEKAKKLARKRAYRKTIGPAYALYNEAYLDMLKGQYAASETLYGEALKSCEAQVGRKHPYYSLILGGLADLYTRQAHYADAEKTLRQVLEIQTETYGDSHPTVGESLVALAETLADQGRYTEAAELVDRAQRIKAAVYGKEENLFSAKAERCLAKIKRQDGDYQKASELIASALSTMQRILGSNHLEVAATMRDQAKVYLDMARYKEAEDCLKDAMRIVEANTGPDHPDRAETARDLGFLYMSEGRYQEAEPQFQSALALATRVLGETHSITADSARDLGELYFKEKKYEEARKFLKTAEKIDADLYGPESAQVASDLMSLSALYESLNQPDAAANVLKRAHAIKSTVAGGRAISEPSIEVPVAFSSSSDRPVREKWALLVGISDFEDPSINLKFAAKDATDFKNFLVSKERFKADHVMLLTNESATRARIIDMLGDGWLGKKAGRDDLVIVYVSSHGSRSQDDAGGVNFLVAHDTDKNKLVTTGIPMQWLTTMIKEQVHSDRVVLIMDVCHSGAAAAGGKALHRILGMDPNALKIGSGQMVLCSSMAEQVSWESKSYENSVFTRRLMEALRTDGDKTSLLQAYRRLKTLVESEVLRDRSNLQTPVLWNKDWQGRDPILAVDTSGGGKGE